MFKKLFIGTKLSIFFTAILLINLLVGVVVLAKVDTSLDQKIADIKEEQRPANLDIIVIKDSSCSECFDINQVLEVIKNYNVNIVSEEAVVYSSTSGQELIAKYAIKTIPALIIKGELAKESEVEAALNQLGSINGDIFINTKPTPPYISLDTKELVGQTNLIMLSDASCLECYDVKGHKAIMQNFGLYVANEELIDVNSARGRQLISQYNIDLVPTIILTGDTQVYTGLANIWKQVGSIEDDQAMIFRQGVKSMGVYKDLTNNQIIDPRNTK